MIPTYKPSGKVGVSTLPYLLLGLVVVSVAALAYQLGLYWIPLIYVSFLLTIGMGIVVGFISSFVVNLGHVRNTLVALIIALLISVTGIGAKFVFQHRQMIGDAISEIMKAENLPQSDRPEIEKFVKNQLTFAEHIRLRVEQGWEIGRVAQNGAPISGIFVYIVWLIEASIIIVMACALALSSAREPYNENMHSWANEDEQVMRLPITSPEMVSQIESAQSVDALLEIPIPKTDESNVFAIYQVKSIPGNEMEDAYLSVVMEVVTIDDKGKLESKKSQIVANAILTKAQREQLAENASLMKDAISAYREAVDSEEAESDDPSGDVTTDDTADASGGSEAPPEGS